MDPIAQLMEPPCRFEHALRKCMVLEVSARGYATLQLPTLLKASSKLKHYRPVVDTTALHCSPAPDEAFIFLIYMFIYNCTSKCLLLSRKERIWKAGRPEMYCLKNQPFGLYLGCFQILSGRPSGPSKPIPSFRPLLVDLHETGKIVRTRMVPL